MMKVSKRTQRILANMLLFLSLVAWTLIISLFVYADVGCEQYNSTVVRCFQDGKIENVTFYDNMGQMWNRNDSRQDWLSYEFGGFIDLNNRFAMDFEDGEFGFWNNSNQYVVWYAYEVRRGPRKMFINQTRWQDLTDDYVTIDTNVTLVQGWHNWNNPVFIYWELQNIDIWNDERADLVNTFNYSESVSVNLARNPPELFDNITDGYFSVGDIENGGVRFLFEHNNTGKYGGWYTEVNKTGFYEKYDENFFNGQVLNFRVSWIDADPCNWGCAPNCEPVVFQGIGNNVKYLNLTDTYDSSCRWETTGFFCGLGGGPDGCTWSDGCFMDWAHNKTVPPLVPLEWRVIPDQLEVNNITNCQTLDTPCYKKVNTMTKATWYYKNIIGIKTGNNLHQCRITENHVTLVKASTQIGGFNVSLDVEDPLEHSLVLSVPPDETTLRTTPVTFGCNISGLYVENLSLYFNGSLNYTDYSGGFTNLSVPVSGFNYGDNEWDCLACTYDVCSWSTNGNWTFTFIERILKEPIPKRYFILLDRSSMF